MKNIKKFSLIVLLLSLCQVDGLFASSAGADTTATTRTNKPCVFRWDLIIAVEKNDKKMVEDKGADPDSPVPTPLIVACQNDFEDIVKMLLGAGANPNRKNYNGDTPLTLACQNGFENIVKILLDAGANPNIQDYNHNTPLISACVWNCNINVVKILIAADANSNMQNYNGDTALTLACDHNREAIVRMLLDAGANPDIADVNGKTALDHCKRPNNSYLLILKTMLTKNNATFKNEYLKILLKNKRNHWVKNSPITPQILNVFDALKDDMEKAKKLPLYTAMLVQAYKDFLNGNRDDLYNQLILMPRLMRQKNKVLHNAIKLQFLDNSPFKQESLKPLLFFLCKTKGDREYVETILLPAPNKDTNSPNSSALEQVN